MSPEVKTVAGFIAQPLPHLLARELIGFVDTDRGNHNNPENHETENDDGQWDVDGRFSHRLDNYTGTSLWIKAGCAYKMNGVKRFQKNYIIIFWLSLLTTFILDFFTKRWAVSESFEPVELVGRTFYLNNYQTNDGIAFGIDLHLWVQILGSIVIIYLLMAMAFEYLYDRNDSHFKVILLGAVIGGGIGNLVDRAVNGFVVDFIHLKPFPVFNVADIGITVGLVLLFATILMDKRRSKT